MNRHRDLPDHDEPVARNATLRATGVETGFWDQDGRPAPWPDDIDDWRPDTADPITTESGQPTF
jgi:hypothetical protein